MKFLSFMLLLALPAWAHATTNLPFQVGEKLTYQIHWGPFIAGKAILTVAGIEPVDGKDCYHFIAEANTTGFVDMLFPVRSRTESWMDVTELCTRRYRQDRSEGKHRRADDSLYDYAAKQLKITNLVSGKVRSYPLEGPVQDMISCLYYVRTKPLQLDVAEKVSIAISNDRYGVTVKPDERKSLFFRPTGTVEALRIEPSPTMPIVAANKGRMWFWVSDDANKYLLMISSDMKIGSARFVLTGVEPKPAK
ncbi:MAG: hypothetical protein PCFJNLEI_01533 [Verrucomicrobiae bacterium]|nr:hypothetical protein [Verrucomicrobiae bacterium]